MENFIFLCSVKITYQKEFRVDFVTQVTNCVPEFAALKARKVVKGVVNDIENQYHETSLKI